MANPNLDWREAGRRQADHRVSVGNILVRMIAGRANVRYRLTQWCLLGSAPSISGDVSRAGKLDRPRKRST
jgi:hypothetical protein